MPQIYSTDSFKMAGYSRVSQDIWSKPNDIRNIITYCDIIHYPRVET